MLGGPGRRPQAQGSVTPTYIYREKRGGTWCYMQGASLSQAEERKVQGVDPDTEGRRRQGKEKV
jgi:hypothetical protein